MYIEKAVTDYGVEHQRGNSVAFVRQKVRHKGTITSFTIEGGEMLAWVGNIEPKLCPRWVPVRNLHQVVKPKGLGV